MITPISLWIKPFLKQVDSVTRMEFIVKSIWQQDSELKINYMFRRSVSGNQFCQFAEMFYCITTRKEKCILKSFSKWDRPSIRRREIFQNFISVFHVNRSCLWVKSTNSAVTLPFTYMALLLSRLPLWTGQRRWYACFSKQGRSFSHFLSPICFSGSLSPSSGIRYFCSKPAVSRAVLWAPCVHVCLCTCPCSGLGAMWNSTETREVTPHWI